MATGQVSPTGQPVYYNQSTQQSFYYGTNGLPVYYNPSTGQWGTTTTTTTAPAGQIVATGQVAPTGQPLYYNQTTGQSFYYDASGQPIYYNATTGQWSPAAATAAALPPGRAAGAVTWPASSGLVVAEVVTGGATTSKLTSRLWPNRSFALVKFTFVNHSVAE